MNQTPKLNFGFKPSRIEKLVFWGLELRIENPGNHPGSSRGYVSGKPHRGLFLQKFLFFDSSYGIDSQDQWLGDYPKYDTFECLN